MDTRPARRARRQGRAAQDQSLGRRRSSGSPVADPTAPRPPKQSRSPWCTKTLLCSSSTNRPDSLSIRPRQLERYAAQRALPTRRNSQTCRAPGSSSTRQGNSGFWSWPSRSKPRRVSCASCGAHGQARYTMVAAGSRAARSAQSAAIRKQRTRMAVAARPPSSPIRVLRHFSATLLRYQTRNGAHAPDRVIARPRPSAGQRPCAEKTRRCYSPSCPGLACRAPAFIRCSLTAVEWRAPPPATCAR